MPSGFKTRSDTHHAGIRSPFEAVLHRVRMPRLFLHLLLFPLPLLEVASKKNLWPLSPRRTGLASPCRVRSYSIVGKILDSACGKAQEVDQNRTRNPIWGRSECEVPLGYAGLF